MQGWTVLFCHRSEHLPREWISPAAMLYFIEKLVKTLNLNKTKGKRKKEKRKQKSRMKGGKNDKGSKKKNKQRKGKIWAKKKKQKCLHPGAAGKYMSAFQWHILALANPDGWELSSMIPCQGTSSQGWVKQHGFGGKTGQVFFFGVFSELSISGLKTHEGP